MNQVFIVAIIATIAIPQAADAARFVPLGTLSGMGHSAAYDVSADGNVVVGNSGDTVFRWTQASGMTSLGGGPGAYAPAEVAGISGDGQVIIGIARNAVSQTKPFKWTQAGGVVELAPRLNPPRAISYDGSTIVSGPTIYDVSWDGKTVVGTDSAEGYVETSGERTYIGDLPGFDYRSSAQAVSPDGTVVVGGSATLANFGGTMVETDLAVYWTEGTGLVPLGDWQGAVANDISLSKLVIIGFGSPTLGVGTKAFRWTPAKGMQSVDQLLLATGIDVGGMGWTELAALAVSANGRTIVGYGHKAGSPQAWLAELDIPGDFDSDGDSDGNDFLNWQRGYSSAMDAEDFSDWLANISFVISLQAPTATTTSVAVPEPTSSIAASLGLLVLAAICHRCAA